MAINNINMQNLNSVTSIVTHSGGAHMDDLLVVCVALFLCRNVQKVLRRDPTTEELADPTCLVLDVGGQHDPSLLNFDHHQFDRSAPPACALSLFAEAVELEETPHNESLAHVLGNSAWYERVVLQDAKGPFGAAKKFGVDPDTYQALTANPIAETLLRKLGSSSELSKGDIAGLRIIGESIVESALETHSRLEKLAKTCGYDEIIVGGSIVAHILVLDSTNLDGLNAHIENLNQRDPKIWAPIVATVTRDPRGSGWKLFRYKDNSHVDFQRIKDEPNVVFCHAGGFVATTASDTHSHEASDLVRKSYK